MVIQGAATLTKTTFLGRTTGFDVEDKTNKHGARSLGTFKSRLVAGLVGVLALLALLGSGATNPVQGAGTGVQILNQGTRVTVTDGASKADCTFNVVSVNASAGTGPVLANAAVDRDGPKGSNTQYVTIAYLTQGYNVCTQIATVLESGSTVISSVGCKNSQP